MTLDLYTRAGCHLCERLEELVTAELRRRMPKGTASTIQKHDIDADENLVNLYGDRVPVLTHAGEVIIEGNPTPADVANAIAKLVARR